MLSIMALILGGVSVSRMPVDLFPQISIPMIQVATFYNGASPQDVERSITYPIEKAVSSVADVEHVQSTSKQGLSLVQVWFNYDANLDEGELEVIEHVQSILNALPPGVQQPFVVKLDISSIPVCSVTVAGRPGAQVDERRLYDVAYNTIEPQLEHLPHVASAAVNGGKVRQINVLVDRDKLAAIGAGLGDVTRAVNSSNFLLPSGDLKAGDRDYNLFTNTQFRDIPPISDVVVKTTPQGAVVHVGDVAQVEDGSQDQTSIVRVNGQRGVFLMVLKQPNANTIEVVDAVRAALGNLTGVPDDIVTNLTFDQSTYIRESLASLRREALVGALLAVIVILAFIRSVRATLIISVAIPLSIVSTFALLYFFGQTLNIFTLGGLALGIGRLVDDSIVELENIQRHLTMGSERTQAALDAAQEVAMPILASTITTVIVFLPVVFLNGLPKLLFMPLALTITFALFMSFLVSRTVTPLLCIYVLRPEHAHDPRSPRWSERQLARAHRAVEWLDDFYERTLAGVLRRRRTVILSIVGLFFGSLVLGHFIGSEFFPATDESQFQMTVKLPVGTRAEETEQLCHQIEDKIRGALPPETVTAVLDNIGIPQGRSALFSQNSGPHAATIQVYLAPPAARPGMTDLDALAKVRTALTGQFPGVSIFFIPGGLMTRIVNFGSPSAIDVEVTGYDLATARALSRQVRDIVAQTPGTADVQISREENYPELDVDVDREKSGVLGFTEQQVANDVLTAMSGDTNTPSIYTDPTSGNEYYIIVRLDQPFRQRVEDLANLLLTPPTAHAPVPLSTIAAVTRSAGPVQIDRKYQQRIVHVTANAVGRDLGSISADLDKALSSLPQTPGFNLHLGGQTETQRAAFLSLLFAAVLALALVYMVMASQFRSLLDPLIIMFSVPLGITGVLLMLFLTNTTLSVNSFMGIIMMVGIVVSNGVLLVDFIRVLRERGVALEEAVRQAGRTRLRPILMTTLATVLGLIPMALGMGEGSESNEPLARAVIGGLMVSTFLTLLLVPAVYVAFEQRSEKRRLAKTQPAPVSEPAPTD
jgi:CzcA family heavy metal efflux pump